MLAKTEFAIIEALCNGRNPCTLEPLDTPRNPRVDRLRLDLLDALQALSESGQHNDTAPTSPHSVGVTADSAPDTMYRNKGMPWLAKEDDELKTAWATGVSAESLEAAFGRTAGALLARLVHLGVIADRDSAKQINKDRLDGVSTEQSPVSPEHTQVSAAGNVAVLTPPSAPSRPNRADNSPAKNINPDDYPGIPLDELSKVNDLVIRLDRLDPALILNYIDGEKARSTLSEESREFVRKKAEEVRDRKAA